MKNITVTYTLEVIEIIKGLDDSAEEVINSPTYAEFQKGKAKEALDADDVVLNDFKVFVQDAPEQECDACKIPQV